MASRTQPQTASPCLQLGAERRTCQGVLRIHPALASGTVGAAGSPRDVPGVAARPDRHQHKDFDLPIFLRSSATRISRLRSAIFVGDGARVRWQLRTPVAQAPLLSPGLVPAASSSWSAQDRCDGNPLQHVHLLNQRLSHQPESIAATGAAALHCFSRTLLA